MSKATATCLTRATAITLAAGWVLIALFVGEMRLLRLVPLPVVQAILFGITLLLLLGYWRLPLLRSFVDALPLRALVLFHLVRFVGIYFLLLHARGKLPYAFAVPGGWGDIAVATGAILITLLPPSHALTRRALLIWNAVGLLDILFVVTTAMRLGAMDPGSMVALTELPLSFLPLLVVPLVIATHVIIFVRLLKKPAPARAPVAVEGALPL